MSANSHHAKYLKLGSPKSNMNSVKPDSSTVHNSVSFYRTAQLEKRSGTAKWKRNDEHIMDTNNSSIVSKRSVEKLYYGSEREYYRYFVNKFKRRSPLINRGYWLRMKAVEHAVRGFLAEQSPKRKIVINLGCGYDPLPFVFLGRQPNLCTNTMFVDVDFPALMRNKCDIVEQTEQLHELLDNFKWTHNEEGILGTGDAYLAVGCDLRNLEQLKVNLQDAVNIDDEGVSILFVAEVSLAYMELEASQAVLEWAATYRDVRFCMLEQHLPDGADHPFASTMLAHFQKLKSPLNTISTMNAMKQRFVDAAWSEATIELNSLWELWSNPTFLSAEQRRMLDVIEPFDEWEEFALFGSHYFLLLAERKADQDYNFKPNRHSLAVNRSSTMSSSPLSAGSDGQPENVLDVQELPGSQVPRRYAALVPPALRGQDGDAIGLHGGLGTQERLDDCDTYSWFESAQPIDGPPLRAGLMCHTVTRLGSTNNCLLVGGRTSPDRALADCWLRQDGTWQKTQSLHEGRYRHCAVPVRLPTEPRPAHTVLVYGGRTSEGHVLDEWLLWSGESGWQNLRVVGDHPSARFGAAIITDQKEGISGVIIGGMTSAGRVLNDFWHWNLQPDMSIICQNVTARASSVLKQNANILGRFGAQMVRSEHGILLIGGVAGGRMLTRHDEILNLRSLRTLSMKNARPLFIGATVQDVDSGILLLGGGATCFSFGTYWSKSCFITTTPQGQDDQTWKLVYSKQSEVKRALEHSSSPQTASVRGEQSFVSASLPNATTSVDLGGIAGVATMDSTSSVPNRALELQNGSVKSSGARRASAYSADSSHFADSSRISSPSAPKSVSTGEPRSVGLVVPNGHSQGMPLPISVPKVQLTGGNKFTKYLEAAVPIIIEGLSLGSCTHHWTNEYLKEAVGFDRKVVVHSSTKTKMDFQTKNFNYETQEFGSFIDAAEKGDKVYLRSLSKDAPSQKPTNLTEDFPEIAQDFNLPDELSYVASNAHSTPLRISGPVMMWLHYDVMANVLCQIRGRKRVILFSPSDVANLGFEAGASSSSLDVFAPNAVEDSYLRDTRPQEAILGPGDVLFIPSTWAHTAAPIEGMSVAVNCFFRSLENQKYAAGRDVYGNRDLAAYEKGRKDISKIINSFGDLPADVSGFYLQRLAMELFDKAKATSASAGDHLHSVNTELG